MCMCVRQLFNNKKKKENIIVSAGTRFMDTETRNIFNYFRFQSTLPD